MDKDLPEKMRGMYEFFYKKEFGDSVIAVISESEPGNYEDNSTISKYKKNGYKLMDANIFGQGFEKGEILIFVPDKMD